MAYLYKSIVYKNPQIIGVPDNSHSADQSNFESNHKSTALLVNNVILAETTFEIDKSYTDFKALIVSPLTWEDVEYTEDPVKYTFNLLSDNEL